jgi:hypothetical protein
VRKTPLSAILTLKALLLPRQARDKHREKSTQKKRDAFFAGMSNLLGGHVEHGEEILASGKKTPLLFFAPFLRRFNKS